MAQERGDLGCGGAGLPDDGHEHVDHASGVERQRGRRSLAGEHCATRGELGLGGCGSPREVDVQRLDELAPEEPGSDEAAQRVVDAKPHDGLKLVVSTAGRGSLDETDQRGAQRPLLREADMAAEPEPLLIEARNPGERVVPACVAEAGEVAGASEHPKDRAGGQTQRPPQVVELGDGMNVEPTAQRAHGGVVGRRVCGSITTHLVVVMPLMGSRLQAPRRAQRGTPRGITAELRLCRRGARG